MENSNTDLPAQKDQGKRFICILGYLAILIPGLFSTVNTLFADSFTCDGEIRERFETLDGVNKKAYGDSSIDAKGKLRGESDDRLLLQRIIAGFTYKMAGHVTCNLHMYDARVWGWSLDQDDFVKNQGTSDEYVMDSNEEYFELHDANMEIKDILVEGLSSKLGRQKIWYGDKRIFGPGGWGNSIGWIWDAGRFSYKFRDNYIDAWYGQTKTKDPESFSLTDKHAYQGVGFYSHYRIAGNRAVEPFFAWKNSLFHDITPEEKTVYYGSRFYEKDFHGINCDFTYVRETGDIGDKSVRGYGYVAKAGYRFRHVPMKPHIVVGRVFASGDSNQGDSTIGTYTRPFGSTDGEHYGRMDLMFWGNMIDDQINLYLDPIDGFHLKMAYHNFSLDKPEDTWSYYKYKNKPGNHYTHLGDEFDFQLKYDYSNDLGFDVIYAYFDAGDFVRINVEDNDAQRVFLQCTYRFHFPLAS